MDSLTRVQQLQVVAIFLGLILLLSLVPLALYRDFGRPVRRRLKKAPVVAAEHGLELSQGWLGSGTQLAPVLPVPPLDSSRRRVMLMRMWHDGTNDSIMLIRTRSGGISPRYENFTMAVLELPFEAPRLSVQRTQREIWRIKPSMWRIGDEEFIDTYSFVGDNEDFARALLTPEVRNMLMSSELNIVDLDVVGRWMVLSCGPEDVEEYPAYLAHAVEMRDRFDPDLARRYPVTTSIET